MKHAPFPIDVDGSNPVCMLQVPEPELSVRFGEGLDVRDSTMFPGPVRLWALVLGDGQLAALEYHLGTGYTVVYANPRDLERVVAGLGIPAHYVVWRYEREPAKPPETGGR